MVKNIYFLLVSWFCQTLLSSCPVAAQDSTAPCQFPFIFKDVRYTQCTTKDDPDGKLWCSTKTDNQDNHILMMGHWKYCKVETRIEGCSTYPDKRPGDCIKIQQCPSLNKIIQKGQQTTNELDTLRKSLCASDGGFRVCCPRTTPTTTTNNPARRPTPSISRPSKLPKNCGVTLQIDRIVNGEDAQFGAWPWMAIFRAKQRGFCQDDNTSCRGWANQGQCQSNPDYMLENCKSACNNCPTVGVSNWVCGGVLITDQYVLSAAHCFKKSIQIEFVRIGEYDLSKNPDSGHGFTAPKPQDIDIERVIQHPQYNAPGYRRSNDIALVKLAKPAELHQFFVTPVCLPDNPQKDMGFSVGEFQGKQSWATGWGVTKAEDIFTTKGSQILQQVNLTIQERNFCRKRKVNYPDGDMILCAGQGDGRDVCRADSGGPIMLSDKFLQRWYIVGVTSLGATVCGDRTAQGVFTSVHYYMDWIKQTIL